MSRSGSTDGPRAVVVGGSIGGLNAALALRAVGCQVDVFERSAGELASRGAGIGMQPSMVRALAEHGIDPGTVSTESHWLRYYDRAGEIEFQVPTSGRYTAWNTLHGALLKAFGTDRYHLGESLVGISEAADGPVVRFGSGRQERADLVVCADGANSTGRGLLAPGATVRYAGYIGWRALIPERELPRQLWATFHDSISYCVLREQRSHIIIYPVPGADGEIGPGERRVNLVWYWNVPEGDELADLLTDRKGVRRVGSVPAGLVADHHVKRMRTLAAELMAPQVNELVGAAAEPFVQTIVEVGAPRMVFGRICLLGDAAFAVRPHAGAATAKSAEDAWALGRALRDTGGDVAAALTRWERRQLPVGRRLLARCAELGDRSQVHGTWRPGDRSLAPGLFGPAEVDRPADW